MKRYLILVWYYGEHFFGSQRQPDKRAVESELIDVLISREYILDSKTGNFKGAARTDRGVNARQAAFAFTTEKELHIHEIDSHLSSDIGIDSWAEISLDFHPRYTVEWKEYRYHVLNTPELSDKFNLLKDSMKLIQGNHEFENFRKTDPNREKLTQLNMIRTDVIPNYLLNTKTVLYYTLIFQSKSFLWEQIRRLVSFVLKIISGEKTLQELETELGNPVKSNKKVEPTNPEGLILWKVKYPDEIIFQTDPHLISRRKRKLEKLKKIRFQQAINLNSLITTD